MFQKHFEKDGRFFYFMAVWFATVNNSGRCCLRFGLNEALVSITWDYLVYIRFIKANNNLTPDWIINLEYNKNEIEILAKIARNIKHQTVYIDDLQKEVNENLWTSIEIEQIQSIKRGQVRVNWKRLNP